MHKKIMLVDDNPIDRFTANISLKKNGFAEEVILKESAMEALDYLQQHIGLPEELPSLIFLDINMPEMNGFEFLDAFAKLDPTIHNTCVILMLSTSLNPDDHARAASCPFVRSFLTKPLMKQKLLELEMAGIA